MKQVPLHKSEYIRLLVKRAYGARQGGAKTILDGRNNSLGIGKTTAGTYLACYVALLTGYQMKVEDGTLSGQQYLQRYRNHPGEEQPSVLVIDDMVAAGGGDARRSMSNSNLNLARAWELQRAKKVFTFATMANQGASDKRLQSLADFRFICMEEPIGTARVYKLGTDDFSDGYDIRYKFIETITWPKLVDNPFYNALKAKKKELADAETYEADDLAEEEQAEEEEDDTLTDPKEIGNDIIEDDRVEDYVSVHNGNGTKFIDKALIELDYDIGGRRSEQVKKYLEKRADLRGTTHAAPT